MTSAAGLLAILLLSFPQDALEGILKRLSDDAFDVRQGAQKELHDYLEDDGKAQRVRNALEGLELDARQRAREALDAYARRQAGWIAYIRRDGTQELWVVRPDGTEARALTKGLDVDFNHLPAWSPDARRLAFVRSGHVVVIDLDGKNLTPLTAGDTQNSGPTWHPDGTAVVFASYFYDKKSDSGGTTWKAAGFDGGGLRALPGDAWPWRRGGPEYSPDGKRRASDFGGRISVREIDEGGSRHITEAHENTHPVWSRDGKWIAFNSGRNKQSQVCVTDPEGKEERPVTTGEGYHYNATWSPDSRRLAFMSTAAGFEGVCVVDLDGKNLKLVTDRKAQSASWSPALPLTRAK